MQSGTLLSRDQELRAQSLHPGRGLEGLQRARQACRLQIKAQPPLALGHSLPPTEPRDRAPRILVAFEEWQRAVELHGGQSREKNSFSIQAMEKLLAALMHTKHAAWLRIFSSSIIFGTSASSIALC